jgi:hypothetical protein
VRIGNDGSRRSLRILSLTVLWVAAAAGGRAEEHTRIWLGVGLGTGGSSNDEGGVGPLGQLVYQKRSHYIAARGLFFVDPLDTDSGGGGIGEVGILYGRASKGARGHVSLAAGLARTSFGDCHRPNGGGCSTLGVPVVAEGAVRPARVFGIGAQLFANLNSQASYGGLMVFLQLGWMR